MKNPASVQRKAGLFFNLIAASAFIMILSVVSQIMVMLFGDHLPFLGMASAFVFLIGSFLYASNKDFMALFDEMEKKYAERD